MERKKEQERQSRHWEPSLLTLSHVLSDALAIRSCTPLCWAWSPWSNSSPGEGFQEESQDPDDTDDHLGGCGRQPGLEGVDDGHVPGMEKQGQTPVWAPKSALGIMHCSCPVKNSLETLESW